MKQRVFYLLVVVGICAFNVGLGGHRIRWWSVAILVVIYIAGQYAVRSWERRRRA